jgi:hypothetical protein
VTAEQCFGNIGAAGRRKRMTFGVVTIVLSVAVVVVLIVLDVHRLWRLALFLPLVAGATGIFQARAKT